MNILQRKQKTTEYFNPGDYRTQGALCHRLREFLDNNADTPEDIIILCIGTDRATGDALGPIVGSILTEKNCGFTVYGTLKHPVHALNLREYINKIYSVHITPTVVAIDASLGREPDVGLVTLSEGPLQPGIGVNKKLPAIGDISITGIVNISGKPGLSMLQSTRLYTVKSMAEYIAGSLLCACSRQP